MHLFYRVFLLKKSKKSDIYSEKISFFSWKVEFPTQFTSHHYLNLLVNKLDNVFLILSD